MTDDIRSERSQLMASLAQQIKRLAAAADTCVFTVHAPNNPDNPPILTETYDREKLSSGQGLPVRLDFHGIGVWYICYRDGDTFTARHILLKILDGQIVHQETGTFEGFWEDWPRYTSESRWLHSSVIETRPSHPSQVKVA
ncbi:hypothetical protein [Aestuariispira ectoiniformans]|uniref:hypothetical protein n=1 Tax=Aestuariispira ectoiniformans TaxID=2775080 RepID=UPI00223B2D9F|nr:hypothetical protein [Aestuariispira ectoiniformans]